MSSAPGSLATGFPPSRPLQSLLVPRQTSPDLTLPLAQPITLTRGSHCLAAAGVPTGALGTTEGLHGVQRDRPPQFRVQDRNISAPGPEQDQPREGRLWPLWGKAAPSADWRPSWQPRPPAADEAGTARILRGQLAAVDPIVASHGGRIVKTTGDGVLLELSHVECGIAFPGSWRSAMPCANGMVEFENGTTVGRQISQPIPRVIEVRAG